jgi:putative hemolysin
MTYSAQLATRPADIDAALRLRHEVYVNRMGLIQPDHPYVRDGRLEDPYDARSHHLVLRTGGQVVGTARFTCASSTR